MKVHAHARLSAPLRAKAAKALKAARLPFALTLALVWCVVGCTSSQVVSVKNLRSEYEAPPIHPVKSLDFAKLSRPAESNRRIQPGDVLEVTCSSLFKESKTETFPVRVGTEGTVSLPMLSEPLRIGSMTCGETEQLMRTAYRAANLLQQPQVSVRVLEYKKKKVFVMGAVKNPGMVELRPDESDPLRAILAAGGVTDDAGSVVEIRRATVWQPQPKPAPVASRARVSAPQPEPKLDPLAPYPLIPVSAAAPTTPEPPLLEGEPVATKGEPIPNIPIEGERIRIDLASKDFRQEPDRLRVDNGDIVCVEQKKKHPFFVTGSVNKPGEFPVPGDRDIHVLEAISLAGGVSTLSEPNSALVVRRPNGQAPIVIRVKLDRAAKYPEENIRLMAGDVVTVEENAASQARRTIREFIRMGVNAPLPGLQ
jgi:polysaccharide export outer membrane protein